MAMLEVARTIIVKCVIIWLEIILSQQKNVGKYVKFKLGPLTVTHKKFFTFRGEKFVMMLTIFH